MSDKEENMRSSSETDTEDEEEQEEADEEEKEESVIVAKPNVAVQHDDIEEPQKTPAKKTPAKNTPSNRMPSKSPHSPKVSYVQLVGDAIITMKDRTGSSQVAIQKFILANHPEVDAKKLKQRLLLTLKTGVANNRFIKIKASYKIHPDAKKKKTPKKKKKKKKLKVKVKVKPEKKKPTKAELAAQREKERQDAKEKERLERIRKRKFPMDDLRLVAEDKELKVSMSLPSRPNLPLVLPEIPASCKSDSMGSGIWDDAFCIYHFFRGDVGWGRWVTNKQPITVVAPFTLEQWMQCIVQILRGGPKKSRLLPPLLTHLFVVALQHLVPSELQVALTPASWSEVLLLYMDAMERYCTTEASANNNALPGLAIDAEYLLGRTDEPKDEAFLEPPTKRTDSFYLQGALSKAHTKLFTHDPWMLGAEELLALLKALVDDLLATVPECSTVLDTRVTEVHEFLKQKRAADAHIRKVQTTRNKEQNEEKQKQESSEKATRSNTKLATVSEAQVEAARRTQQRATDAYDKACRSQRIRTEPIGEDRHFHAVYHFWNDPQRIYVLQKGKHIPSGASYKVPGLETYRTAWHSLEKRSVVERYIESLDVRGKRESGLSEALKPIKKFAEDDIKVMNDKKLLLKEKKELQRKLENAKLKCEFGRKSGRLAAQSETEFAARQAEIDHLEDAITGEPAPAKPDLQVETGLRMLRDFDMQEEHNHRRRATRRDVQKQQEEEEENKLPRLHCSRLWSTGNIDGTGIVGLVVWELLELEERVEKLASCEQLDRKTWIANLESAAHSWHAASPPKLEEEPSSPPAVFTENGGSAKKQQQMSDSPGPLGSPAASTTSISQILAMLKQPLLELEGRVFEMTGLAMASQDADEADDNMSASPEDNKEEQQQAAWKKLIHRLHRLPAKAHSKIRQTVVEAIAAARKAQQGSVVAQLRDALLQFHPAAAGACKTAALEILDKHGGYDDADDEEDEEDQADDMEEEPKEDQHDSQTDTGISSVLCAEAVILNSSLDGQEDANRADWIIAVKKTKTVSKIAALAAAFCTKATEKLEKLESESKALNQALEAWEKASLRKKKPPQQDVPDPSEVWANVAFTDEFCLAKVEQYPWWPAKKCFAKDRTLAATLESLGRTFVSLVGESGGLRVVKTDALLPFSETLPEDEDLSNHPKDIRTQLDECMTMARRIIRGKDKKASKSSKKRKKSTGCSDLKEEKKLAT